MKRTLWVVALAIGAVAPALGQNKTPAYGFFSPAEIKWSDGPASLPPGAKIAVLEGNPAQEGPFTMRLKLPDGYTIQPHWHTAAEHVTVISGTLHLGLGEKFDKSAGRALPAGSFGFMSPGVKHYGWTTGETVLQVHGTGPWKISYLNPGDARRNKK